MTKTFSMGHNKRQNPQLLSPRNQTQAQSMETPFSSTREQEGQTEMNMTCVMATFSD